jgi:hypothetical protein
MYVYIQLLLMSSKKLPIDPICAMCRIILLNFKNVNTKIGVTSHAINLQDPTMLQGVLRYYYGDGKEDMFGLFYLIIHLITWFLVPVDKTSDLRRVKQIDEQLITELKKMVQYMCQGLEKLQNTYKAGNVVLTLQYYINLLEDALTGTFNIKRLPACLLEDVWIDSPLKNKIIEMWDYERLRRISAIYDDCFAEFNKKLKLKDEIINGYLVAVEQLLCAYEKEFDLNIKQWG